MRIVHVYSVVEIAAPEDVIMRGHVYFVVHRLAHEFGLFVDLAEVFVALLNLFLMGGKVSCYKAH